MQRFTLYLAACLALFGGGLREAQAQTATFAEANELRENPAIRPAEQQYTAYRVLRLNVAALQARLAGAPLEFSGGQPIELALPLPHGGTQQFAVVESPVLSPALSAQNPGIKTYSGQSLGSAATVRFSMTNGEFNALFLGVENGTDAYIQRVAVAGQPNVYLAYATADIRPPAARTKKSFCGTLSPAPGRLSTGASPAQRSSGGTLRTFRLAITTTSEFTNGKGGGTQSGGFTAVVQYVNRLVAVYRRELSVNFTLVSTQSLVYTTSTDPYPKPSSNHTNAYLAQIQTVIDTNVGSANYDVGHLLGFGPGDSSGGGVAQSSSVCNNSAKAKGISDVNEGAAGQIFTPVYGDQVFCHEIGHQFSMQHTYNSSIPVCTTREQSHAVEPGAGTTIMSYGYTCSDGTGDDNYETGFLPFLNFHARSLEAATAFIGTVSCFTSNNSGNAVPVIGTFTTGNTIPKSTPFVLTGTATDADAGNTLTYSWEGMDLGATAAPGPTVLADEAQAPFFRSYEPSTTGATRTFPRLSAILDGTNKAKGDKLPAVGRVVNLKFTVRDNVNGVNEAAAAITIDGTSGPFLITSNLSGSYTGGQSQTVTWSVNNTNNAPVSCANVRIMLSTDGGQTFPITVAASTANDGSEAILMPNIATATTQGRLRLMAVGNIFFDISNSNFSLAAATAVPTLTGLSPTSGPVGTSVTLTGTGLTNVTGVSFNGTAATVFSAGTGTTATATVPAGAGTGNVTVTVTTAGGTSNGVAFTVVTDLVVSTGTQLAPATIPAGNYNSITITDVGNSVLAGNVSVATFFTVQPGGGLSDGCSIISGAGTFTLGAGSILGICSPQGITASGTSGSVQVTGTRSFSTAANYGYTGAAAVTGSGLPSTVASLAINTAGNVTLSNPVAVSAAVGVGGAGNLLLNGNNLTLLSSATGTALARNSSTGIVSGNTATVQRFIASANTGLGYRHYGAPVSGSTVSELATTGFSPEIGQAATYNASATPGTTTPFPTVFAYDQSRVALTNSFAPFDRGFVVPSAASTPLAVGQGYAVNIAGTQLVDFVGTLNTGAITRTLARNATGSANADEAGWHLVGNPYPAPIDYSLVAPADRANLDAAMYVFESVTQYTGSYRPFVNGLPTTNSYVGTAQGFFVRVSSGQTSGTLNFQNSQRVTDPTVPVPFRRDAPDLRPLVQLDLRGATGAADAFYTYAQPGATAAFDAAFDARKLPNTTGLNLASVASTGEALSIDGRPAFAPATALALTMGVPATGTYTLVAADLANLPAGLDAFLTDAATGQTINLRTQPSYAFAVTAAQAATLLTGRFTLAFGARTALAAAAALTAAEVSLYPNPAHGTFTVQVPAVAGATAVQATLLNALGQAVRRQSAALSPAGARLTVETAGLAAGVYTLRLQVGTAALAKRVVIQ